MPGQKLLPVLLALALVACGSGDDNRPGPVGDDGGIPQANAYSLFDPTAGTVPFPSDFLFNGTTDGTLNIPNAAGTPFVDAANLLDGFSTTASLFTDFIGYVDVDAALAAGAVLVIDTSTLTPLTPGVDYRLQSSTAIDPGTGFPLNILRTRMLIEPLKPLKPSTRYLVVVTRAITTVEGAAVEAAPMFRLVRSTTPVAQQAEPVLTTLDPTKIATLETIRLSLAPLFTALGGVNIQRENIVIAWPFTTQSTTKTLQRVAAQAQPSALAVVNSGRTTADAVGVAGADLYGGRITLPYYLGSPVDGATAPLTKFWEADHTLRDDNATSPAIAPATCANLPESSFSTTMCYPMPVKKSDQTVPVLVAIPNAASGQTMPVAGWPVVIFQHGITGNRTQMAAIAPALARAGFATVAIDLPLHGVPVGDASRVPGSTERTFDLDVANNATGAAGPDGVVDDSGTHFINLSSLLTSRDNLRQAAADLVVLSKSVGGTLVLTAGQVPAGITFDGTKVHFIGHSLGGIVGTTFLGVSTDVTAGVLAMPGGGIAKLLDGSQSFGPRIAAGLLAASNGSIAEGNDNFETFLRFAQTTVDSGDPLNFAAAATANHPLLMLIVKGDTVVPNCTIKDDENCPATDTITVSGYLSGSHPLARVLGLEFIPGTGPTDVLNVPITPLPLRTEVTGHRVAMRFGAGDHGSILSPQASPRVTCEMQSTASRFLASSGTQLQIGHATCAN